MNDILELVGLICIAGASYLFANKHKKENYELKKRNQENDSIIMFDNELLTRKTEKIEKLTNNEKFYKDISMEQMKKILKLSMVNDKTTEMLEQEKKQSKRLEKKIESNLVRSSDRFAKDQIKIDELTNDYNFAREISIARHGEIRYLRRKMKCIRTKRLLKVVRAERIGGNN